MSSQHQRAHTRLASGPLALGLVSRYATLCVSRWTRIVSVTQFLACLT